MRLMSVSSRTSSSHSQKELKKSEKLKESIASHTNQKQDDWYQRHLIRVEIKMIVFTGRCVHDDAQKLTPTRVSTSDNYSTKLFLSVFRRIE